jgi:hypothetical protein
MWKREKFLLSLVYESINTHIFKLSCLKCGFHIQSYWFNFTNELNHVHSEHVWCTQPKRYCNQKTHRKVHCRYAGLLSQEQFINLHKCKRSVKLHFTQFSVLTWFQSISQQPNVHIHINETVSFNTICVSSTYVSVRVKAKIQLSLSRPCRHTGIAET